MTIINLKFEDINEAAELINLADSNEEMDIIQEKNFSGDITTVELYVTLGINIITVLAPIIKSLIDKHKVSGLKIDGETIELNNVSEQLVEKILMEKLNNTKKDND